MKPVDILADEIATKAPYWLSPLAKQADLMAKIRDKHRKLHEEKRKAKRSKAFNENEPRDEHGRWTDGGSAEFVSPSVDDTDFSGAVSGFGGERHKILREASAAIDNELKLASSIGNAVGAWQDGAENTVADFHGNTKWTDWPKIALAASMRGWLGNQKSVLAFQEKPNVRPRGAEVVSVYPGKKFDVQVNPTGNEIRSMAKDYSVRILVDADGNLFAWDAGEAIHSAVAGKLDLDEKHEDIWYLKNGKLVSDRETGLLIGMKPDQEAKALKAGAQEVRDVLHSLEGHSVLVSFEAKGSLEDIHNNLLKDGLAFHTIIPHSGGATVFAAAVEAKDVPATIAATKQAAGRYEQKIKVRYGRGEFIGDTSGEPARDRARSIYEANIERSPVYNSDAIWGRIRAAYGNSIEVASKAFNENEPRDEHGRWTDGGGSSDDATGIDAAKLSDKPLDDNYSKDSVLKNGVIHTSSVKDAARALYEDRAVELKQPRQVSTLLKYLGHIAKHMEAKGEKAPDFNLCNVSVKGTNLFCAQSAGIPRIKMPQLDGDQPKEFVQHLKSLGYSVEKTTEKSDHLRATQSQLIGAKVAATMKKLKDDPGMSDRRLIVSRDNYILDGHHHWAAQIGLDAKDNKLGGIDTKITRVDIGIIDLLKQAEKFTGGKGHKKEMRI